MVKGKALISKAALQTNVHLWAPKKVERLQTVFLLGTGQPGTCELVIDCAMQDEFMHTNLEDKEEYETVLASVRQVVTLQRAIQSMREGDKARYSLFKPFS